MAFKKPIIQIPKKVVKYFTIALQNYHQIVTYEKKTKLFNVFFYVEEVKLVFITI